MSTSDQQASAAGYYTRSEIASQPEAWRQTLGAIAAEAGALRALRAGSEPLIYTGCGSPYYLALSAAARSQELGLAARGLPASEIWLSPDSALPPGRALLVAASRSGETTETLRACETFRAAGRGPALTLAGYPGTAIATAGDLNLLVPAAQEQSVAQTRAFTSLLLATFAAAALWAGRADALDELELLPDSCARLLATWGGLAAELGRDLSVDRFYFLGSGVRYGLACELSLKMKEMTLSHSEPFHALEFRHGPKAMAGPGALVVGLTSRANAARELAVLAEMRALGARTLAVGPGAPDVDVGADVGESAAALLALPFGQLLAFERALAKGLNPDRPGNLDVFVRLEG